MLRTLYIGLRYGTYMRSEHGLNALAEVLVSRLVGDMIKGAGPINQFNANLRNERSHLLQSSKRHPVSTLPAADPGVLRSRFLLGTVTLLAIAATAFLLYFTSLVDYVGAGVPADLSVKIAAGLLAAALTGSGMYVCERMVEIARAPRTDAVQGGDLLRFVVWAGLLVAVQVVVFTIMAGDLRSTHTPAETALQYGMALAGVLLPVLGGFLLMDVVQSGTGYRMLRAQQRIEDRMVEIDAMLERNDASWRATVRARAVGYWKELQTFKLYKGIYDARRGHTQEPLKAFAVSFAAFEREAERRFRNDPAEALETLIPIGDGLVDSNFRPFPVATRPVQRAIAPEHAEAQLMAPVM